MEDDGPLLCGQWRRKHAHLQSICKISHNRLHVGGSASHYLLELFEIQNHVRSLDTASRHMLALGGASHGVHVIAECRYTGLGLAYHLSSRPNNDAASDELHSYAYSKKVPHKNGHYTNCRLVAFSNWHCQWDAPEIQTLSHEYLPQLVTIDRATAVGVHLLEQLRYGIVLLLREVRHIFCAWIKVGSLPPGGI
jgi:hypothetical protein